MPDEDDMKVEMSVNHHKIKSDETLIYTLNILNQKDIDLKNIIANFILPEGLSLIGGMIKRQRGMMEIDQYIDLEIGNLVCGEGATIKIELKPDGFLRGKEENEWVEVKGYALVTFDNPSKSQEEVKSKSVYAKVNVLNKKMLE